MISLNALIALAFFPVTVIWAGIGDLTTMKIPNRLVLTMLAGYVILAPYAGFSMSQIALSLAGASMVFFVAFGAFAKGWMGGGDVKLMAVAALWLGLPQLVAFLLFTCVSGAVLTLVLMEIRSRPLAKAVLGCDWAWRLHSRETGVPYGMAIAMGSLIAFASSPWMALR